MKKSLPLFPSQCPSLSVIVPAHEGGESLLACLSSLARANPPPDEVILVADGEDVDVRAMAAEFRVHLVRNPSPGGPARARNRGAACAGGDLLFFVDSDVTVPPDTIGRVRSAFLQDSELAAVFGSYDDEPAAGNFLSQYRNLFHHYIHQTSKEEASTFFGACGAIRRDVFMEMRGFDERYGRPCIEDIELGGRLGKQGYRIRLDKTLQCKHLKGWGVLSLLRSDFFDRGLPWTDLILRKRLLINDLNLKLSNRLSAALLYGTLLLLAAAFCQRDSLWPAAVLFAAFLVLNYPLYRFFSSKRGFWFMIKAVPWHCVYYLCCGLAFAVGLARAIFVKSPAMPGK
jgi:GT2 family glycosyltransferase